MNGATSCMEKPADEKPVATVNFLLFPQHSGIPTKSLRSELCATKISTTTGFETGNDLEVLLTVIELHSSTSHQ